MPCVRKGGCNAVANFVPERFYLIGTEIYNLAVYQFAYLLDNSDGDCNSLLVSTDEEYYIMGTPLFRVYDIGLDYNVSSLYFFPGGKQTNSPITGEWGNYDASKLYESVFLMEDFSYPYNTMCVGGSQCTPQAGFDT